MMQFLRKHQKKLFILIAIMTVASFAFMGNSSMGHEVEEKKIGKAIDGKAIYARDIHALTQFISMGPGDFLKKDLIDSGAIQLLAEKYFNEIDGDFRERLQKARTAKFYTHPQYPLLNAVQVWNTYAPYLMNDYQAVIGGFSDAKNFSRYAQLYVDQQRFPPELLRTILFYQQYSIQGLRPDPNLQDVRALSLFGYQSFEEWFGSRFTELLGKFVINTAAVAQKKGYKVSLSEARAEFKAMCYEMIRKKNSQQQLTPEQVNEFMRMQLQAAGVDESYAIQLWRKVMLVHRYFQDVQQGVLVDSIPYEQFTTFADAQVSVDVYQFPEEFRSPSFQVYLDAVSPEGKNGLPCRFYSVDEIEKRHPELITSRYELEVAKVTQDDLNSRVPLKELWGFEKSDAGFAKLIVEYPVLNKQESTTADGREKILDGCDPDLRRKVDRFAKQLIFKEHPEWLEEAFAHKKMENHIVQIRSKGAVKPFEEIEETLPLRELLQKTAIGETVRFAKGGVHYQIKVIQKPQQKEVLTFKEAKMVVDEKASADESRLQKWLQEAQKSIQKEGDKSIYLTKTGHPLSDQWTVGKTNQIVKRSDVTDLPKDELFSMQVGSWSSNSSSFFQLVKRDESFVQEDAVDLASQGQLLIGQEVMRNRIEAVLDEIGAL